MLVHACVGAGVCACAHMCTCSGHVFCVCIQVLAYASAHVLQMCTWACICALCALHVFICVQRHECVCSLPHPQTAYEGTKWGGPGSLYREVKQSRRPAGPRRTRASLLGDEDVQEQGGWWYLSPVWVPSALRVDCLRGSASPATEYTPDTEAKGVRS